jgi:hypothetical protein
MNKCKTCGGNCDAKEYCFRCKLRKPLAKTRMLVNTPKKGDIVENKQKMHEFFQLLWKKFPHYSMVSGKYLGKEPLTIFFHHILPKEKYPQARLDEENIILLTLEEHTQVEMDMYRFEEINNRRNNLLIKYERNK